MIIWRRFCKYTPVIKFSITILIEMITLNNVCTLLQTLRDTLRETYIYGNTGVYVGTSSVMQACVVLTAREV